MLSKPFNSSNIYFPSETALEYKSIIKLISFLTSNDSILCKKSSPKNVKIKTISLITLILFNCCFPMNSNILFSNLIIIVYEQK